MFSFSDFFKAKPRLTAEYLTHISEYLDVLYEDPACAKDHSSLPQASENVHALTPVRRGSFSRDAFSESAAPSPQSPREKYDAVRAKCYDQSITRVVSSIHTADSFVSLVQGHIRKAGVKDSAVYKAAGIDRRLFSHMMSDDSYQPSKDTAIAVCLGLRLSLYDTMMLLNAAGYTLSSSIKRDLVFKYFILNENYDLQMINETLYSLGYKTLGRQ